MYVQYRGGCSVLWGCSVPWGYHEYRGGYLEYHESVQYRGGYHDKWGDILSTMGCSVPWGIL